MNLLAIVQARLGSTRLPRKIIENVSPGWAMIDAVLARVTAAVGEGRVVLAMPGDERDIWGLRPNVPIFWGETEDVLSRYVGASELCEADAYVRFTADCPLLDVGISTSVIDLFQMLQRTTGKFPCAEIVSTSPEMDGLDTEVFTYHALMEANEHATGADREHVTSWMKRHLPHTEIRMPRLGPIRWSVDDADGLEFVRRVYRACPDCAVGVPHHTNAGASIGGADRSLVLDLHVGEGGGLRECTAADILQERVGAQWRYSSLPSSGAVTTGTTSTSTR